MQNLATYVRFDEAILLTAMLLLLLRVTIPGKTANTTVLVTAGSPTTIYRAIVNVVDIDPDFTEPYPLSTYILLSMCLMSPDAPICIRKPYKTP